ncbi:hypothetical protein HK097_007855, partial [Rhizophlyctis rosea]
PEIPGISEVPAGDIIRTILPDIAPTPPPPPATFNFPKPIAPPGPPAFVSAAAQMRLHAAQPNK